MTCPSLCSSVLGSRRKLWRLRSCSSSTGDVALVLLAGFLDATIAGRCGCGSCHRSWKSWKFTAFAMWSRSWRHATDHLKLWRCRRCSSCGCGGPCDQAATWGLANLKCLRFSSSPGLVDIPVRTEKGTRLSALGAMTGFSTHFASFFGLLRLSWS